MRVFKIYTNGASEPMTGHFDHARLADNWARTVATGMARERKAAAANPALIDRWADVRAVQVEGGVTFTINALAFPAQPAPVARPAVREGAAYWHHVATLR